MVTSPTGKGVIVIGGRSSGGRSEAMFELSASMQWTRLEQKLQIGKGYSLAIPVPENLVEIVKTKKKSNKNDINKTITHEDIEEWVKKRNVAKNMKKVDLVIYLQSIGVKVTTSMKAKKDNLVQEVYGHFLAAETRFKK